MWFVQTLLETFKNQINYYDLKKKLHKKTKKNNLFDAAKHPIKLSQVKSLTSNSRYLEVVSWNWDT